MSLSHQYDFILNTMKQDVFDSFDHTFTLDKNMAKGFSVWRPEKTKDSEIQDNIMRLTLEIKDTAPNYYDNKEWIKSEYPKFYIEIIRKSMTLAPGEYFGIYYDNKTGKIAFTKAFIPNNRIGNRLSKELEKKMEEFIEQFESEHKTIFYIMKTPSIDVFIIDSIQQKFEEKVQQAFRNYVDVKDENYRVMDSRNEFL